MAAAAQPLSRLFGTHMISASDIDSLQNSMDFSLWIQPVDTPIEKTLQKLTCRIATVASTFCTCAQIISRAALLIVQPVANQRDMVLKPENKKAPRVLEVQKLSEYLKPNR